MHSSHNTCADRSATVTVFGCGNPLFGDDGFGPAVIDRLARHPLPEKVRLIDAGTGIREHLLDYLLAPAERPGTLIIADACFHRDRAAGELR
jgi:coenzyme F420 hydrogenase subunit delta